VTPAIAWLIVGPLELWWAWVLWGGGPLARLAAGGLAWCGASTVLVGLAYVFRRPDWLGKGRPWRWALAPILLLARGVAAGAQRLGLEERVEVAPGLWVGGWPRRGAPGFAQLDLTAELPRRGAADAYRCVPMLDGAPPSPDRWEEAVSVARAWRAEGRTVLIHCAFGHGRSVCVLVGVMVLEGLAPSWEDAQAAVKAVRPGARMTQAQRRVLDGRLGGKTRS
jgi:hypothetical protein